MQIWMVAMLAVSAVLILRDMAKLVFTGRKKGRPVYDVYPQKEKIDRYARSLQKLAHTFYEMPGRQEQLSQAEVQDMFVQVQQRVCMECSGRENCWSDLDPRTSQQVFELLQVIEEGNPDRLLHAQSEWLGQCHQAFRFTEELQRIFFETREELLYRNRLIENRIAVAEQLQEVARTIRKISSDVSAVCILPDEEEERMRKYMHKQRILVKQISDGSFSGASSARIPPFSITSTRSAYARTSSNRCSIKRIVVPSSALIFRSVARKSPAARGSSWEVGSSNTRRSGCIAITAARFRSCFCPPESSSTLFSNQVWIPKKLAISATRSRIVPVSYPRFSSPNANSCHTLSVTSWLSGLWST